MFENLNLPKKPILVGAVFKKNNGDYYREHCSGIAYDRLHAHVFTKQEIKEHMQEGANGWGGKLHGKWIPIYIR